MTEEEKKQAERKQIDGIVDLALGATLGESSSELSVSFKKTVLIRDYETEVVEANSTVKLDEPVSGAERVFISAIVRIQLEYEAYCNLLVKGMVTETAFDERKKALAYELVSIKQKAEAVTGKSMDKYLHIQAN